MNNLAEMIKKVQKYFTKPLVIKGKGGNFNDVSKISFFDYETVRYLELSSNYRLKFVFKEYYNSLLSNLGSDKTLIISLQFLGNKKDKSKESKEINIGNYNFKTNDKGNLIIDCKYELKINDSFESTCTAISFYLGGKSFKLNTLQDLC